MSLPIDTVAGTAMAVLLAYTVFGLTGFGSSITAMPLLVHFLPLSIAVPMMLIFDLCAGLLLGLRNWRSVERKELLRLVPFMLCGMALGLTLLMQAPERALQLVLGIFVLAYSGWSLLLRPATAPIAAGWSAPIGTIGGVFTALFGIGGPIYTIYLARRLGDKLILRATISSLIFLSAVARLVLFTGAGLYAQNDVLRLAVLLLPCAMAGLYLGNRLHNRLPAQRVAQVVWGMLILSGVNLVLRNI